MNTKKYHLIFYFITVTIVATIAVQLFWNYNNYEENKVRISNEIQLSLDNAIEEYYAKLAKEEITTVINFNEKKTDTSIIEKNFKITNISITSDEKQGKKEKDSILKEITKNINPKNIKSVNVFKNKTSNGLELKYFKGKKLADSLKLIDNLKPLFISITSTYINYKKLDSLIENQLKQKEISIDYTFQHFKSDSIFYASKDSLFSNKLIKSVSSKSTYLKKDEAFKLLFTSPNYQALKRSSFEIFLSLLLSLLIISCLFYLLKIINQQKDLATIKNDLISNITHEFKTPIATVSTAIEAIENFNVLEDKEKTKKYLSMSSIQLKKLHQMVEKLLETATLDSEQLMLKKETIDIAEIIEKLVNKHQLLSTKKELVFSTNLQPIYLNVDVFHFENAISNLIDNAIKYGGDKIEININSILNSIEIIIADNGEGIDKNQQEKIFDKFYRVPKGNTHNVKGFGIGLYYCKKIIEKHLGTIDLTSTKNKTIFKINLPNE
ncbi:HAMP domain-containing histidine kinase [Polaribacter sp. MSW13]|uniref:histidine kinase n=1 Tax=Polaribacter marinus TaxID=2916838 RepID=A0A9X1VQM8_9FLAO|nr:HAMP domain-containing sensor histidine kinase [Polaribacter marinus]MCI2228910.1 HAMP domain-containing histidine kinase [Polaribacter marinus]